MNGKMEKEKKKDKVNKKNAIIIMPISHCINFFLFRLFFVFCFFVCLLLMTNFYIIMGFCCFSLGCSSEKLKKKRISLFDILNGIFFSWQHKHAKKTRWIRKSLPFKTFAPYGIRMLFNVLCLDIIIITFSQN